MIPVANVYYLLCYAWDEFAPKQIRYSAAEDSPDTLHLFADQLVRGMHVLRAQGFETGYLSDVERTQNPRGKILMAESIQSCARRPIAVCCAVDERTVDVPSNRILKATLARLMSEPSLDRTLRNKLRECLAWLPMVRDVCLDSRLFHEVRLHQSHRVYSFLLAVCRFLFESMIPTDRRGTFRFRDVDQDERRMRRVFQQFVRNFYARTQKEYDVKGDRIEWDVTPDPASDPNLLPAMYTDASLRSRSRTVIIECKYTAKVLGGRFAQEKHKLRSEHLYQLNAYLRNIAGRGGTDATAEGILLYPTVGVSLDQSYRMGAHRVRIATVDLNQAWPQIEKRMLSLIQ